jgi:hypothetical protein
MSDHPRTDAAIAASDGQWSFVLRDLAQELERELAESAESLAFQTQLNREVIDLEKKTFAELAAERALADRLAGCFENVLSDWFENYKSDETPSFYNGERALAAYKEACR